jgi:hypothetical protein
MRTLGLMVSRSLLGSASSGLAMMSTACISRLVFISAIIFSFCFSVPSRARLCSGLVFGLRIDSVGRIAFGLASSCRGDSEGSLVRLGLVGRLHR